MIDPKRAALIMIDMQNGFIDPSSSLCVAGAEATVPSCAQALARARAMGMAVFHVRRIYSSDGSDVEPVRYRTWLEGGKPLCPEGDDPSMIEPPEALMPFAGDRVVLKPRFSAFFNTPLNEELTAGSIDTVVLIGTTTPNCIRSTCYDALSLNYNVAIIEDCTSSRTPEVQRANIEDMAFIGAYVLNCATFCKQGLADMPDISSEVAESIRAQREAN